MSQVSLGKPRAGHGTGPSAGEEALAGEYGAKPGTPFARSFVAVVLKILIVDGAGAAQFLQFTHRSEHRAGSDRNLVSGGISNANYVFQRENVESSLL